MTPQVEKAYPSSQNREPREGRLEGHALRTSYHRKGNEEERKEVHDTLEVFVQEGARRMLAAALEEEVNAFLGRHRYQRGKAFRGYRNGYHLPREVTVGLGPVEVRVPRVAQVPPELAPQGFRSQIVRRYQRASQTTQRLFRRLYLEGLATGDFEPVFRELVGETTALSANAVVRLKECWGEEYAAWRRRPLGEHQYAYIWGDGIYLSAGMDPEKMALLCVLGARDDGEKELLTMEPGYRESAISWAEVLRDLRVRGLQAPLLGIGDGVLGLWAALDEVFPTTQHQRCWNHRVLNVQAKLPKPLQPEARRRLREMTLADTRSACQELRDRYVADLRAADHNSAAETVLRDWESFVTFYHYPREHWIHLRTTNPLESSFSGVRLRTNAAKRLRRRDNALYLVFKIAERLSGHWRTLNGGANLMALVLEGCVFKDGRLPRREARQLATATA
jgi:putative transposase